MKKKAMTEYTRAQVRKEDVACAGRIFNENGGCSFGWNDVEDKKRDTHSLTWRKPATNPRRPVYKVVMVQRDLWVSQPRVGLVERQVDVFWR